MQTTVGKAPETQTRLWLSRRTGKHVPGFQPSFDNDSRRLVSGKHKRMTLQDCKTERTVVHNWSQKGCIALLNRESAPGLTLVNPDTGKQEHRRHTLPILPV